jgi:hypothetical protein
MDWLIRVGWKKAIISFGVVDPSGARRPLTSIQKSSALSIGNRACLDFQRFPFSFVQRDGN